MYPFPSQEGSPAWLMQSSVTPGKLSSDAYCWPLLFTYLKMSMANKSVPLFCMPCKKPQLHGALKMKFKLGRVKWPRRLVAVWTWLSQRRALNLRRLCLALETKFARFTWTKGHARKEMLHWLWCEQACQLWHSGIPSTLALSLGSKHSQI